MSQTGKREDKRRTPSTLNWVLMNVIKNSVLHSSQKHDHSKVQLENAQEVALFPLKQQRMSVDLLFRHLWWMAVVYFYAVCSTLWREFGCLCLCGRDLLSTWTKLDLLQEISQNLFLGFAPNSQSYRWWHLSKKLQPPPLCAPCIAWNLTFLTHTSLSVFFFSFFSHQQILLLGASLILSSFLFHNLPHTAGQTHSFILRHTHTHTQMLTD